MMACGTTAALGLDDRLRIYLPQTRHGALTVRQMLGPRLRAPAGAGRPDLGNLDAPDRNGCCAALEDAEQVLPFHFAFHYSNLAYALLGQGGGRAGSGPGSEVVRARVLTRWG